MGQLIIEHILLQDPRVALIPGKGKAPRIESGEDLLHMGIDGKGVHMMQGEQTDAVRHLFSDTVFLQQKRQRVFIGAFSQQAEPFPALLACTALRHAEDIFIPIAKAQPFKPVWPAFQNRFRRREGVNAFIRQGAIRPVREGIYGNFFSVPLTERLQAPADPGDVIVLGNEEADDGLPQVLPQDPDAAAAADGGSEEGILRVYRPADRSIVPAQIKIAVPEV